MLEIFAGGAVLCSVAKQYGLTGSMAIDKVRKRSARSTIFQLDLMKKEDRVLLETWLSSPLVVWVHLAPVCGTASRARDIQRAPGDPLPLRSIDEPHGLSTLQGVDLQRVTIANHLFEYACWLCEQCCIKGVLVTMENPKNSYFWITKWAIRLMLRFSLFCTDFQVCMYGGLRDKWTKIVANFAGVSQMDISCDRNHRHLPWGKTRNAEGKSIWATSEESQYPRKMCVALTQVVLQQLKSQGLTLLPESMEEIHKHPLLIAQKAQVATGIQRKMTKLPPLVPQFSQVATFRVSSVSAIPCALMSKLSSEVHARTITQQPTVIPAGARFLRFVDLPPSNGGELGQQNKRPRVEPEWMCEVVFGLPWDYLTFIEKAQKAGHPLHLCNQVPEELNVAVEKNIDWDSSKLADYRISWCRRWLKRCSALEQAEKEDRSKRSDHVQQTTQMKRLLVTSEILADIAYDDMDVVKLLREGSIFAGDIEKCSIFQEVYRPCLTTVKQLQADSVKRNQVVLNMTKSSGDHQLDLKVLEETELELAKGWTVGPVPLHSLEEGAIISRRFPLVQGAKTRMIDDFSISGVNDSSSAYNKIDLHTIDAFAGVIRSYFERCEKQSLDSQLVAKTYDLKSAYRQVPIRSDHLRFAYFSIFNAKLQKVEIYQLRTLPFGATHSVYSFLRLSRMLFAIASKALFLLTTNFYDDFLLASKPALVDSASNSMELLFMITGGEYAKDGKKATCFDNICRALGVEFNLHRASERVLQIYNTQQRIDDLVASIDSVISSGKLTKQEGLVLRG